MANNKNKTKKTPSKVAAIIVEGYKSIATRARIELRPLTILAGANSSGKSSAMQPWLLLKQTLDERFDPGPLKIDGGDIEFTSSEQLLSRNEKGEINPQLSVGIEDKKGESLILTFRAKEHTEEHRGFELLEMVYFHGDTPTIFKENMSLDETSFKLPEELIKFHRSLPKEFGNYKWEISRQRCFLGLRLRSDKNIFPFPIFASPASLMEEIARGIIHVPGLRGNPVRTYRKAAVGHVFPGAFQNYHASIINAWKEKNDKRLNQLEKSLEALGLTSKIKAINLNDAEIEIRIGRTLYPKNGSKNDCVSIADVGFGVSQVLPVIVALLTAEKGQIVYLEQPEIHLHPLAQVRLAKLLADAAKRGVIVVAETHSDKLLLGVQALVAEDKLDKDLVKLHWFKRNPKTGFTTITPGELDKNGAFGDWPEDFGEVGLDIEGRYLDAAISGENS
jgi:AAA15 family ATPase/GTPase